MGRPQKPGLTYFPLDVHIADDIELLEVDCGLEGFAILVKLWQKIYSECYYIEWGEDHEKLFSRKIAVDHSVVKNVIENCFKRGLFSKEMFDKYSILTSHGVQKRYLKACTDCKRTNITMIKEYLLIKDEELLSSIKTLKSINSDETEIIAEEMEVFTEETNINSEISTQSKVKESKEEQSKELKTLSVCDQVKDMFNSIAVDLPKVKALSEARKKAINARVKEHGIDLVREAFITAQASEFLSGRGGDKWKASFDWIMNPNNFIKVIEGNYSRNGNGKKETKSAGFINGIGNVLTKNGGLDDDKERNSVDVNENQRLLSEFPDWNERKGN